VSPDKLPAAVSSPLALQGITPDALMARFVGLTATEARKVVSRIHRGMPLSAATPWVRREHMAALARETAVPTVDIVVEERSREDPFMKLAVRLHDGAIVETVRIPLEKQGRFSVCVSSQVGCALGCTFCATGRMGLGRNLETWEIIEQVRVVKRTLGDGERVRGVVFQGMGEPLANLDRVLGAIEVMSDPSALAIDARAITVCTSGLPAGIVRLAESAPRVRLGLSIGSARAAVRRTLMPIDAAHCLESVLDAAVYHARTTGLSPMWAVTLLAGVNDTAEDGRALAALARDFEAKTGRRPRISVIPYNSITRESDPFARATPEAETSFRDALREGGFGSHKRYSGGADVGAACGQLSLGASVRA
jgi:23S rRNA (adenine2503-C2)-methyltransferase